MRPLAFAVALLLVVSGFAQKKSGAQELVEKQIAGWCAAMKSKDLKGIESVMTADYSASTNQGTGNREQALTAMKQLFAGAKSISASCKIKTFKIEKGNAHITCSNVIDVSLPAGKKTSKFHNESETDEIWVPVNGTYKIRRSKELSSKTTINGKPIG